MKTVGFAVLGPLFLWRSDPVFPKTSETRLPCSFSGELLRTKAGGLVQFTSAEMKDRATRKVEISGLMQQADIKATVDVDVVVGVSGEVVCLKCRAAHPLIHREVEKALSSWQFRPARSHDRPVAYLGNLKFTLCNISCGEQGTSMTLLR